MLDYALNALRLGFCVMPAAEDGTKQPLGNSRTDRRWKQYQTALPTEAKVREWYASGIKNIGYICGEVSGNLEVIDFDDSEAYHEYKSAAVSCGLGDLVQRIESGYLEHSPKGVHWFYRCNQISGNLKLASREKRPEERLRENDKVQVMIETRGQGGYIIAAPTTGPVNPKGEYRLMAGALETVATITPEERNELHKLAMTFCRMPKQVEYAEINTYKAADGTRPGDDFAERTSWNEILEPHGWKRCFGRNDEQFWTRPGKSQGISATTNYAGSGLFYCFSSSTVFEPNRGFSKFAVYTYLNHHGNFEAAAASLNQEGFGTPPEDAFVETRPLKISKPAKKEGAAEVVDVETIPATLTDIPGMINDFQHWFNSRAIRKQPVFAFAASLAFAGLLMGRRVETQTGLRTNLMIIALGDSASGKNEARNCIRSALIETGNKHLIGSESIGSEAGMLDELASNGGHAIYQLDEIGHALQAMTGKKAAGYLAAVVPMLMKLQSSAGSTWIGRSLKKGRDNTGRQDIEDPCVIVYGTSVPEKYFGAIDYTNIEDGFVPRFLIFQTNTPFPPVNYKREQGPTPEIIIEHIERWTQEPRGYFRRPEAGCARVVKHTEETMTVMRHFETLVQKGYRENRAKKLHAIWGRAQATAEQLALLFTCSQNPDATHIDPKMAAKACMLTKYLCDQQMIRLDNNISSGELESDLKSIKRSIEESQDKGISKSELTRRHQAISAKRRAEIITTLLESNQIILAKVKVGDSQKATAMYFSTNYASVEEGQA